MKSTLILLVLAALLTPAAHAGVFPYKTVVERLDNGLQVIVIPMSSGGLVSYWSIVRTGSRDEIEAGRSGFAHFFEHMMFRGTERFPATVYNDKITEIGADANAFTSNDLTAYYMAFGAEDLATVLDLESDRFQNLSYAEDVFKTEAGAVYGEYRKNRASPFFTAFEALQAKAFEKHTYGHTTMGFVEDIQRMPTLYQHSRDFFSRFYRPENVTLLIVGDVEPRPTLALVRRFYGGWKPGYQAPQIPQEPEQTAERRLDVTYEGNTLPILWLAYKAGAYDPQDRTLLAAQVLCDLLFGETSELYRKLVLEDQLVEDLSGSLGVNRDPGLVDVIARVKDPAKVDAVLATIDAAIARSQQQPPSAERLAALKSRIRYDFLMGLDSPPNVARQIVRMIAVTGSLDGVEKTFATYDQITADDVLAAARRYFVPERRTVAVLRGEG